MENVDGVLKISSNGSTGIGINLDERINVYAPGIVSLEKSGSGDMWFKGVFTSESLTVNAKGSGDIWSEELVINGPLTIIKLGSGDITLEGKAGDTVVNHTGSGDVNLSKLETVSISVNSRGSGDVITR